MKPIPNRAETDAQKEEVMRRVLEAWKRAPYLRLGQLLYNAAYRIGADVFTIEDDTLTAAVAWLATKVGGGIAAGKGGRDEECDGDVGASGRRGDRSREV